MHFSPNLNVQLHSNVCHSWSPTIGRGRVCVDSYRKYASSYASHLFSTRRWRASPTDPSPHYTDRPDPQVEVATTAMRTQSLTGFTPLNTANCVQWGPRPKPGKPALLGTELCSSTAHPAPTGHPLAALIQFWDCCVFCVAVTGSTQSKSQWFNPMMLENHLRDGQLQIP